MQEQLDLPLFFGVLEGAALHKNYNFTCTAAFPNHCKHQFYIFQTYTYFYPNVNIELNWTNAPDNCGFAVGAITHCTVVLSLFSYSLLDQLRIELQHVLSNKRLAIFHFKQQHRLFFNGAHRLRQQMMQHLCLFHLFKGGNTKSGDETWKRRICRLFLPLRVL